jgi:VCBS repeat-containing protein
MRLGGLVVVACVAGAGACIDVAHPNDHDDPPDAGAPQVALADSAPIVRHPGATVRVAVTRDHPGFSGFAAVWIHTEQGQNERLQIDPDGQFDWTIDRNGTKCEIAGTVVLATVAVNNVDQPALTWTMTVNNCNSSYQGKSASDIVMEHTMDHLVIKDAEFQLDPVPYDRERSLH